MNLKRTFQLQIEILLKAEQTELEVLLATGYKLQLSPYWMVFFWGGVGGWFFLAGGPRPSGQALQSFACLLCSSMAVVRFLPECEGCKMEPILLKKCVNPISHVSKSFKGKLE